MRAKPKPASGLPEGEDTPEFWETTIANLNRDKAAGEVERGQIEAERRSLALAATAGDPAAVERVAELNQRQVDTARRLDLLAAAMDGAKAKLAEALAERQRAMAEARKAEAATVAEALVAQSARADALLVELVAALSARGALARKLAGLGGASVHHLMNRTRLLAAAQNAGLGGQLEIGRCPRHLCAPLQQIDRGLLRDLLPPGEAEAGAEQAAVDPRAIPGQLGDFVVGPSAAQVAAPVADPAVRW